MTNLTSKTDLTGKTRLIAEHDFRVLLNQYISLTFNSTTAIKTIYQDIVDFNTTTISLADITQAVQDLLSDDTWKDCDDNTSK